MKRFVALLVGLILLAGCSASSSPPIQLSTSQSSLLFFYTEG